MRPRRPRRAKGDEIRTLAAGFKRLMHVVRMSRRSAAAGGRGGRIAKRAEFQQRCAVRLTYTANRVAGQWGAHGRYLMRDGAAHGEKGFEAAREGIEADAKLREWQAAGDPRVFKIIVSPEFGERLDLKSLVRRLMERMQRDLGPLEWVAVAHYNTDHLHAHIALRGVCAGKELRIPRRYVREGIRGHAETLCTRELGYRTRQDALEAGKKEVRAARYTSLDRIIGSERAKNTGLQFLFTTKPGIGRAHPLRARLRFLCEMELATDLGGGVWEVRSDFGLVLKAMQRAHDRQRMLADHGSLVSDRRLSLRVAELDSLVGVEGRVLAHGLDEQTGRPYMLLESTLGQVLYVPHNDTIERARQRRLLHSNTVIEIQRDPDGRVVVNDLGEADALLQDKAYLTNAVRKLMLRGVIPEQPTWAGWLGRWQAAVHQEAHEVRLKSLHKSLGRS